MPKHYLKSIVTGLLATILFSLCGSQTASAAECIKSSIKVDGYTYYAFTGFTACDFTLPAGATQIDYLVVGGGGGGGSRAGGGGGAGGLLTATGTFVTGISSLGITVGDGGAGMTSSRSGGANGSDSILIIGGTTVTATGGGKGSDPNYVASSGGASSGGGSGSIAALNTSVNGQGNKGGAGRNATCGGGDWCGGGGGGAGSIGGAADITTSGSGGNGLAISWITTAIANSLSIGDTSTGTAYFSGGGSGGRGGAGAANIGTAGLGGGGLGVAGCSSATCATGATGKNFTGGGGGGGGYQFSPTDYSGGGGKGGSGVVVIRVLIPESSITTSVSASASFNIISVISATTSVAGKVTFYANGKRIPGCISIPANLTAQCNWKANIHGLVSLTQRFTPTNNAFPVAISEVNYVSVSKRLNRR
jgi:hypothetical protein